MRHTVVVDAGKSAVRCRVQPGPVEVSGPGMRPEMAARKGSGDHLAASILALWRATGLDGADVGLAVIGTTFLPPPDHWDSCLSALRRLWPQADIQLMDDGVLAHAAALGRPGTVASIGTGVIVVGVDAVGQVHRADGWGPDLGDRGSAADLGRAGLRAACAALDGAGPPTALESPARSHLGGTLDVHAAARLLAHESRVHRLADFAIEVCAAAAAGDRLAGELLAVAAEQVADTCAAIAARIDHREVALLGRLSQDRAYGAAVRSALTDRALRVREPVTEVLGVPASVISAATYRRASVAISDAARTPGYDSMVQQKGGHQDGSA